MFCFAQFETTRLIRSVSDLPSSLMLRVGVTLSRAMPSQRATLTDDTQARAARQWKNWTTLSPDRVETRGQPHFRGQTDVHLEHRRLVIPLWPQGNLSGSGWRGFFVDYTCVERTLEKPWIHRHEKHRSHFHRRRNERCRPATGGRADRRLRGDRGQGLLGAAAEHAPDAEIPGRSAAQCGPPGKRRRAGGGCRGGAFELEIRTAGAFPKRRPTADLVAGHGPGQRTLAALHAALESALRPLGFPKEHRRFAAHLTIGRVRGPGPGLAELGPLIAEHADFSAGRFPVAELVLFSSQLTPQGPVYDALSRAALRQ